MAEALAGTEVVAFPEPEPIVAVAKTSAEIVALRPPEQTVAGARSAGGAIDSNCGGTSCVRHLVPPVPDLPPPTIPQADPGGVALAHRGCVAFTLTVNPALTRDHPARSGAVMTSTRTNDAPSKNEKKPAAKKPSSEKPSSEKAAAEEALSEEALAEEARSDRRSVGGSSSGERSSRREPTIAGRRAGEVRATTKRTERIEVDRRRSSKVDRRTGGRPRSPSG